MSWPCPRHLQQPKDSICFYVEAGEAEEKASQSQRYSWIQAQILAYLTVSVNSLNGHLDIGFKLLQINHFNCLKFNTAGGETSSQKMV